MEDVFSSEILVRGLSREVVRVVDAEVFYRVIQVGVNMELRVAL